MHIPWTSLDQFHTVRRTLRHSNPSGPQRVTYRAKVKLHGTNSGVQRTPEGLLECQSRERLITPGDDNCGFARWVDSHRNEWLAGLSPGTVVFGEWGGPGVMGGVALSRIPNKVFAVFAMLVPATHGGRNLIVEPARIAQLLRPGTPCVVLPWYKDLTVTVDWNATPDDLAPVLELINEEVRAVEACDPWVKDTFGIEGTGEGLVFYPVQEAIGQDTMEDYFTAMFKAKGEKHKTVAQKAPAQADPEVVKGLQDFAALVLAEARLEQGALVVKPDGEPASYDMKRMGTFLGWISKDVAKECGPELTASGLDAKAASKAVTEHARKWYLAKIAAGV